MSALHRFIRNPNYLASPINRIANRSKPLQNTLVQLQDSKNDRTLYLIGTTNSSSMLAYRTQKLIEDIKPDVVFVQANEKFGKISKQIHVQSQKEMNEYNFMIMQQSDLQFDKNVRSIGFAFRFYSWLFVASLMKYFPKDFHPFIPGLEMKLAIETGEKNGAKIIYGGMELSKPNKLKAKTLLMLQKTKLLQILSVQYIDHQIVSKMIFGLGKLILLERERDDVYNSLSVHGGETFAESVDQYRINWFVQYIQKLMPEQKKIFIDLLDEDLFYQIYKNNQGKKIVAVVNQWHMEGIENHWRNTTQTQKQLQPINPIGDFDIEKLMENRLINDKLREITSKITNSEPATHQDVITHYHKEVQEFERTRHVHFNDAKDHHMYHGLPEDSDDAPLKPLSEVNQQVPLKIEQKH